MTDASNANVPTYTKADFNNFVEKLIKKIHRMNTDSVEIERPAKKSFWKSMKTSSKFLILMIISSLLEGFLSPKGAFMPENIVLPYAIAKFLWSIGALGWCYFLVKETRSS